MIELKKGNWDKLEGRVVSYSRLSDESAAKAIGMSLFSVYASTDVLDFVEKLGLGEEAKEVIQSIKDTEERAVKQSSSDGANVNFMPIYMAPIRFQSENDILTGNHDIIFNGNWSRLENCVSSLDLGVRIYSMRHAEQIFDKHGFNNSSKNTKNSIPDESESYTSYSGKSLKSTLLNNYVTPMLDANTHRDFETASIIGTRMAQFSNGATFSLEVLKLMTLVKSAKTKKDYDLIDHYLNEIDAIHLEKFEEAGKYRDLIYGAKK